jgi:hypothetical protein
MEASGHNHGCGGIGLDDLLHVRVFDQISARGAVASLTLLLDDDPDSRIATNCIEHLQLLGHLVAAETEHDWSVSRPSPTGGRAGKNGRTTNEHRVNAVEPQPTVSKGVSGANRTLETPAVLRTREGQPGEESATEAECRGRGILKLLYADVLLSLNQGTSGPHDIVAGIDLLHYLLRQRLKDIYLELRAFERQELPKAVLNEPVAVIERILDGSPAMP